MPSEKQIQEAKKALGPLRDTYVDRDDIIKIITAAEHAEPFHTLASNKPAVIAKDAPSSLAFNSTAEMIANEPAPSARSGAVKVDDSLLNALRLSGLVSFDEFKQTVLRAIEPAEPATDAEPVAWRIHAPKDDYYGVGPDTLQFHPLEQWDFEKGYSQTPLYTRPPESRLRGADVDDILLPLEDIHSDRGQCEWHDVAKAIDETRRRLRAALAQEDGR